jgi:hypothetical protein
MSMPQCPNGVGAKSKDPTWAEACGLAIEHPRKIA